MTTAFVLSGGASLGAVQAGMVEVLIESGIEPDVIVGASVGALNGAWLASHPGKVGADTLRAIWLSVRRRDIFPFSPITVVRGLMGRADHTVSSAALAQWIAARAPFQSIEQAPVPFHAVATDLQNGTPVVLSTGDAIQALLATSAIPGVFPPVEISGRLLVDGGISANSPITQAVALGADTVYLLPTVSDQPGVRPKSAPGVALQAVSHVLGQASMEEVRANARRCTLYVVPAPAPTGVSPFDFRHSLRLMDLARDTTRVWLTARHPIPAELSEI